MARTGILLQIHPGRRRQRSLRRRRPALPAQRLPADPSSVPLNPAAAEAYRRVMPRLNPTAPPNTALQRTRSAPLRSPLSLGTFGNP